MNKIVSPLELNMRGADVADLQDALLALYQNDIIWPPNTRGRPSPEELEQLTEGLRREHEQSLFGEATQRFVMDFQARQGLGNNLRGVVEETTAAKLNEWLRELGLLSSLTLCYSSPQ